MHFTRQEDRNQVSVAIFAMVVSAFYQKKFLIKQSLVKVMAQIFYFKFLENDDFFWNSVESSEFVNSVAL